MKKAGVSSMLVAGVLLAVGAIAHAQKAKTEGPPGADSAMQGADKYRATSKNVEQAAEKQPPKTTPFQAEVLNTVRRIADQEKDYNEQKAAKQNSLFSPPMIANFLLVLVGAVYTFFAWRQWCAISRQANIASDTLVETRKSADAAKKSADAVAESTAIARRQMRPFVTVHFEFPFRPSNTDSRLRYLLKNSGKTPAFIKTIQTIPWDGHDWAAYDAEPLVVPEEKLPTEAVIVEDATAIRHVIVPAMDPLIVEWINNGIRPYLVRGLIVYDDISGKRHWTRFSRIFKRDSSTHGPGFVFPRANRGEPNENEIDGEGEQDTN